MFASDCCSYRSPSKLFKMPKRRITRSALPSSPVETKSPRLDKFYKSTKESKEMSPKHRLRSRTGSPSNILKYFSPSTERPVKKRVVPKRRVNLNNVFEHIVTVADVPTYNVTMSEVPALLEPSLLEPSAICLKRSHPQSLDMPSAKCIKIDTDTEQLMEGSGHIISAVSYKTDLPSLADPLLPPPPCVKRTWKSLSGKPGVKLFDPNSPRTASKVQMLCRKLWFSPPAANCEIQTLS